MRVLPALPAIAWREFLTRLAIALALGWAPLLLIAAVVLVPNLQVPAPVIVTLLLLPVLVGSALSVAKEGGASATIASLAGDVLAMFALLLLAIFGGFVVTVATATVGLLVAVPWAMALLIGAVTVGDPATLTAAWGRLLAFVEGGAIMFGYDVVYIIVAVINRHNGLGTTLGELSVPLIVLGIPIGGVIGLTGARLRPWLATRLTS